MSDETFLKSKIEKICSVSFLVELIYGLRSLQKEHISPWIIEKLTLTAPCIPIMMYGVPDGVNFLACRLTGIFNSVTRSLYSR